MVPETRLLIFSSPNPVRRGSYWAYGSEADGTLANVREGKLEHGDGYATQAFSGEAGQHLLLSWLQGEPVCFDTTYRAQQQESSNSIKEFRDDAAAKAKPDGQETDVETPKPEDAPPKPDDDDDDADTAAE